MKTILFTATLILGTTLFFSCSDQDKSSETEPVKTEKPVSKNDNHHNADGALSLNNGEKWEANFETTVGVTNIMVLMDGFEETENVEAYTELTIDIKKEFSNIFKMCTMTGPAHDQLHNFLIPIKNSFKGLNSDDLEICKTSFGKLRTHLDEYDKYFVTI